MNTTTLEDSERQPCEIWTRVMGYHRPVSQFNIGKQSEHRERRQFSESRATEVRALAA
jgi:anaerobic ribonucleoside-triphosphate reductase